MSNKTTIPLSENAFLVLLCFYKHEKIHGYGIKTFVRNITDKKIELSTSSIYSIINKFLDSKIIEQEIPYEQNLKHIYYRITEEGKLVFLEEISRMENLLLLARKSY